jgi:manganese/zinc/iron transport system permease protein
MQSLFFEHIFELLFSPTLITVLFGCVLIAIQTAAIGTFTVLRKQSLTGDAIAHAILPGLCIAFFVVEEKSNFAFMLGAALAGLAGLYAIQWLISSTKLKQDAAIGIVLSVFFGAGILLMTFIQQSGNGQQSGLDGFLLGKASAMLPDDLIPLCISTLCTIIGIQLLKKEFLLMLFDNEFALMSGIPVSLLQLIINALLISSIITGIIATGAILIGSILIIPYSIGRFWRDNFNGIYVLAIMSAVMSTIIGVIITIFTPQIPTGAMIVLILSTFFAFSALFAPKKGIIGRLIRQRVFHRQTMEDNILKYAYHFIENKFKNNEPLPTEALIPITHIQKHVPSYASYCPMLKDHGFIQQSTLPDHICLTKEGLLRGMKITRLHRLWESYLLHAAKFDIDHVHDDAESIEHILTPELEKKIRASLGDPGIDPHGEQIPPSFIH